MDIERYLKDAKAEVDLCLDRLLPTETVPPVAIHRAMRYSIFAGGKRLRPILVLAAGESLGGRRSTLLYLGCCLEMIHTYSLIHDDLPALDNDDLRRGQLTCHKMFGEALAILAGDALLTRCFELAVDTPDLADSARLAVIGEIARAAGTVEAMIGGQVVDLESEGKPIEAAVLDYIHRSKTGALLTACTRCGALAAGCRDAQLAGLTDYGARVGLAFQIVDDILDVTTSSQALGKTAGKDMASHKATYPALYGIEASRERARELVLSAIDCIQALGEKAEPLRALARFVDARTY